MKLRMTSERMIFLPLKSKIANAKPAAPLRIRPAIVVMAATKKGVRMIQPEAGRTTPSYASSDAGLGVSAFAVNGKTSAKTLAFGRSEETTAHQSGSRNTKAIAA